jgi:hypothetical protein
MTFVTVRCPHCDSEQIVKRHKTRPTGPSATCASIPRASQGVFCSTTGRCLTGVDVLLSTSISATDYPQRERVVS